ncbi:ABC transporter substrate-binding protein [Reinekea sp.]|jgi:peptide/nickel transport system substrate-binding protein|uniref:ABC transporter substrate-binding protein n=1 Tax=Reinekea sp. TaxID=1970455 RepID=UPI0039897494
MLNRFFIAVLLLCNVSFASNDLTLIPTHTNGFVRNFNPFESTIGSFYATDFVYEPLWIFNVWHPDKNFPRLAKSVEISEDLESITYTLREGVKWSDGNSFSADDVVFTVDYAKLHPNYGINITSLVDRAEKINATTVKFYLTRKDALAHEIIGRLYPLPKHIFENVDDPVNFANAEPVGTGPFTEVTHFKTTYFKICRNPNYYQADQLKVDCLKFPHYSGNEQLWAAARRGKIDWLGEGIQDPVNNFSKYLETNKYWLAPGANTNLQINTQKAPMNDVKFRRVLSMAINRAKLRNVDTFGLTSPTHWPVGTGPLYEAWYDETKLAPYKYLMEYNPEAAKKALDEAGYVDANNDGVRDLPNGEPFRIGIAVPSGWTDWLNSVFTIVDNYKAIGIDAYVASMDEQKWFERIPTGDFDIYIMWTNPGITPWKIYSEIFNSELMVPGAIDGQAMHQFKSTKIERWLKEYTLTPDTQMQHELISNIQMEVAENVPVVGLFANPIWYQYSDKKFTGWVTESNPYVRPQVHKGTPERLIHVLNLRPVD